MGTDLAAMLRAVAPDFVVNVTAPEAHREVTLGALGAGVAVLSEKPMATSMEAAREMVAAADAAGRLLMVSQNRRYKPTLQAFRDAVAGSGRSPASPATSTSPIGRMRTGSCARSSSRCCSTWRSTCSTPHASSPGAEPVSVYCESYSPPWDWFAGPSAANAIFRMSGDVRMAFNGSWCADGFQTSWTGRWRAVGEHGSAHVGRRSARRACRPARASSLPRSPRVRGPRRSRDRFEGLADALAEFVAALRTGRVPQSEAHDNLRSLAMCHAAVESARSRAPVAVAAGAPWP